MLQEEDQGGLDKRGGGGHGPEGGEVEPRGLRPGKGGALEDAQAVPQELVSEVAFLKPTRLGKEEKCGRGREGNGAGPQPL